MTFLRNSWYVGALASEVTEKPLARRLLNESLCIFRSEDGRVRALDDRCPHRFAPLHQGKVVGSSIQCPYHGLRFNGDGACTHNPHGQGAIPKAARVKSFPTAERHSLIWLWAGDPAIADPALIPDYSILDHPQRYEYAQLYMHVNANYQLVIDNLLDLSHVQYLHPYLISQGNPGTPHFETKIGERRVVSTYIVSNTDLPGLYKAIWPGAPALVDSLAEMTWQPPAFCFGNMRARPVGDTEWVDASHAPNMHMITPETDLTSHYFWVGGYNRAAFSPEFSAAFRQTSYDIFTKEDMFIINLVQQNMQTDDLMSLSPLLLAVDTAAVRARRILEAMIRDEQVSADKLKASAQ